MSYPTHDTDWAESAKGNHWKRKNGKVLVVGRKKDGSYWAMTDGKCADGFFENRQAAMAALEAESSPHDGFTWL